jgi:hypothetical protein
MSASSEQARYYVHLDGACNGPFRLSELAKAGVEPDSFIWAAGSKNWLPAEQIPDVADLLGDQWRRVRQASRKAEQLPDPAVFTKLCIAILCVHIAACFFFVIGTTAIWTSLVLYLATEGSAVRTAFLAGLPPAILGLLLLIVEAWLGGAFLWKCAHVVKVLVPGPERRLAISWNDWLALDELLVPFKTDDSESALHTMHTGLAVSLIFMGLLCMVLGPLVLVAMVLYGPFARSIYRLGYGLNHVVDRYRLCDRGVPWVSVGLGFFTGLSGLLLPAGPLSLVFFVLLPIWVFRTTKVAAAICRVDPSCFVKKKPHVVTPVGPPPSPLDVS